MWNSSMLNFPCKNAAPRRLAPGQRRRELARQDRPGAGAGGAGGGCSRGVWCMQVDIVTYNMP